MRIAADGYISTLEEANKALAECVNGALEEMELHRVTVIPEVLWYLLILRFKSE